MTTHHEPYVRTIVVTILIIGAKSYWELMYTNIGIIISNK